MGSERRTVRFTAAADQLAARLDAELRDVLAARKMPLYDMMYYHLGWSGGDGAPARVTPADRVHGVLCLLAGQAAGGDVDVALPAAAAVELVDNFCKIHDDVQGGIPQRNSRDAVWWVWGPAQAINAGDGMHALARLALFRLRERGVPAEKTFEAVRLLDQASLRLCEGRFMDLEAQERIDLTVDAYLSMAASKSGALTSCAMQLGGLAADADGRARDALGVCGSKIGLAMQVYSDLGELWPRREGDGPASPEVLNKKKLLPVVYAMERAGLRDKRRLGDIYFKRVLAPEDLDVLRSVTADLGARSYCESLVERSRAEAAAALEAPGITAGGASAINGFVDALLNS